MESKLVEWVQEMNQRNVFITDDVIIGKAQKLLEEVSNGPFVIDSCKNKCARGWLWKFKQRHKFRRFKSFGEDGDADEQAISLSLPEMQRKVSGYCINDIWH